MTMLEFISSIISSLAWPISILITILIFKNPLSEVVISLRKIRYKDLEMEFEKLKLTAKALPETIESKAIPEAERLIYSSLEEQMGDIAPRSPEGAVLIAWAAIETAISSAVMRLAISPESPAYRSVVHNMECLEKYTDLDKAIFPMLNELRAVRNHSAHAGRKKYEISVDQALLYGKTAEKVIRIIQNLNR